MWHRTSRHHAAESDWPLRVNVTQCLKLIKFVLFFCGESSIDTFLKIERGARSPPFPISLPPAEGAVRSNHECAVAVVHTVDLCPYGARPREGAGGRGAAARRTCCEHSCSGHSGQARGADPRPQGRQRRPGGPPGAAAAAARRATCLSSGPDRGAASLAG
eukprot:SAG31_NODE_4305_length_3369_cov_10.152599_1_plen_161_part_00